MEPTETIVQAFINMVSSAQWRMTLDQFLDAVEAEDDAYWLNKFTQLRTLAEALNYFDAKTLTKIILYNERVNLHNTLAH